MRRTAASFVSRAHIVGECLAGSKMPVVPPSPYSPDLAPCDFFFSQKFNTPLKESRFNNITSINGKWRDPLSEFQIMHFTKCFAQYCKSLGSMYHHISRTIRRTMIFSFDFLEKNNDECILILVIYWKKTGLVHTKISKHNIIYSS